MANRSEDTPTEDSHTPSSPPHVSRARKPSWLKMKIPGGAEYADVRRKVDDHKLHNYTPSAKARSAQTSANVGHEAPPPS
jgi:lipoate synthase